MQGKLTRYGDVVPLLTDVDSRLAVFSTGDEVALTFDAGGLPPLPDGWTRDYLLHLDGYVKDGDRYTAHPGQVAPMPYAGMTSYPYEGVEGAGPPVDDPAYQAYLQTYQTRNPLRFVGPVLGAPQGVPARPLSLNP